MSKHKGKIFSTSVCIPLDMMIKYHQGQLSLQDMHRVEKHLLDCEFCNEAMDGLLLMNEPTKAPSIVAELNKKISGETENVFDIRRIAAVSAAVFILAGGLLYLNMNLKDEQEVAVQTKKDSKNIYNIDSSSSQKPDGTIAIENKKSIEKNKTIYGKKQEVLNDNKVISNKTPPSDGYLWSTGNGVTEEEVELNKTENVATYKSILADSVKAINKGEVERGYAITPSTMPTLAETSKEEYVNDDVRSLKVEQSKVAKKKSKARYYSPAYDGKKVSMAKADVVNEKDKNIDLVEEGVQKYNDKKYAEASKILDESIKADSSNSKALYYNGLSNMESGRLDAAIANFDKVKAKEYYEASQWNKAMTLLKKGDKAGAKKVLQEIAGREGPYKQKAQEELKKL